MLHRHTLHSQHLLGYWARSSAFLKKFDMAESWTSLGDLGGWRLLKQRNLKVSQTWTCHSQNFQHYWETLEEEQSEEPAHQEVSQKNFHFILSAVKYNTILQLFYISTDYVVLWPSPRQCSAITMNVPLYKNLIISLNNPDQIPKQDIE